MRVTAACTLLGLTFLSCAPRSATDIKELHRRYMEASIHHDLKTLRAMTARDIVWTLGDQTFVGKDQALGPNEFDAGMQTELEYSNVAVNGNTVEFELIERNCVTRAVGVKELHHYPRFVFENGLIKRKESWKDSPNLKQLAPQQLELLAKWIREKHPEALAQLSDPKGNTIFSQETGALTCKLANEWVASKAAK